MSNGTKRAKGALTVTATGDFLMPMIVFKGKPNGEIVTLELINFDNTFIYTFQDVAWMDKRCMLMWIKQILVPYLLANPPPPGIQLVILLDVYQCHMMQLVVSAIAALGVEIIIVPGKCAGLCQPLNVGINKLFKHCYHHLWEEWMIIMLDTNGNIREATHKEVAAWTAEVFWNMMGMNFLKNAWQKMGYDWFEGVFEVEDVDDGGKKANNDKAHDNGNEDNNSEDKDVLSNGNKDKENGKRAMRMGHIKYIHEYFSGNEDNNEEDNNK
jgi:hypothetical protein